MTELEASTEVPQPPSTRPNSGRLLLGVALFLPGALCCLGTLAWPTLSTLFDSLRSGSLLGPGEFVGLDNYLALLRAPNTRSAVAFTLLLAVMRMAIVAVVPLLLALGLRGQGALPRRLVRLGASVPTALYLPALVGLAWLLALNPAQGLLPPPADGSWLSRPVTARLALLLIDAVYVLAVSVALGLAAYLAALRATDCGRSARTPFLVVWGVSVLAALASALQTLALPLVMTRGGPAGSTETLTMLQYNFAFVFADSGRGTALAAGVLVVLMLLGLLATVAVVGTRLRLALAGPPPGGRSGLVVLAVVGLLIAVPACLAAVAIPAWVGTQALAGEAAAGPQGISVARALVNTLLPPVPMVLLQVLGAWVAALGLSGLRPLGRASDWLLLLFAPWLFVTLGPVSLAHFTALREASALDTLVGLIPPLRFSVPMLFVLALFFRGQAERRQPASGPQAGDLVGQLVRPSLPLVGLLFVLGWLAGVQEVLWPLLAAQSSSFFTASTVALTVGGTLGANMSVLGGLLLRLGLPLFAVFVVLLGVLQVTVLDRLVITAGDEVEAVAAGPS